MPAPRDKSKRKLAPCAICKKLVDQSDNYCSGCRSVVCEGCDKTNVIGHGHSALDHAFDDDAQDAFDWLTKEP